MVQIGFTIAKETMFVDHGYLSGTTRSLREHFDGICQAVLGANTIPPEGYVLDIGGNDGTFLSCFKRRGIRVLNIDSGMLQASISREQGVECINDFFNLTSARDILAKKGVAHIIHGSGVFFHLEELHSVFEGVKLLLHPEGTVVAEFIYLPSMVRGNAFDQIYHEHLLYYTIKSFNTVLQQHGLVISDAYIAPIHGGSCIAFIKHTGKASPTERLESLIAREESEGFRRIDVYRLFAERVQVLREDLRAEILRLRREGRRIQAMGAPVKGSTIVNFCGLDETMIECAVELNEHKCDTYIPGTRIPVYHQDRTPPPDVYLMLAWNFMDEILGKLTAFRQGGGKILVPIPEVKLI